MTSFISFSLYCIGLEQNLQHLRSACVYVQCGRHGFKHVHASEGLLTVAGWGRAPVIPTFPTGSEIMCLCGQWEVGPGFNHRLPGSMVATSQSGPLSMVWLLLLVVMPSKTGWELSEQARLRGQDGRAGPCGQGALGRGWTWAGCRMGPLGAETGGGAQSWDLLGRGWVDWRARWSSGGSYQLYVYTFPLF